MPAWAWWKEGPIYQIYPRSFADSDGDGVGDLRGVVSRLDYLNDRTSSSLGVRAIWLSPFYRSPMADFGYDVSDYCDVDPRFGTLADFDRLLAEAHRRGIKVVVDWVAAHTSNQHPWFVESRSSRHNPKRDWYVWRDSAPGGGPPNNWMSAFPRVGRAWTFDPLTGQWYLHSHMVEQPDLNWENPEVETAMHAVLRFWLDRGVDGFRIDAAQRLAKDPALRDNPADVDEAGALEAGRRHDIDWPTVHDRLRRIRRVVDEYDDRMLVAEVYVLDQRSLVQYVNSGDEVHLAHNFFFLHLPWKASAFRLAVEEFEALASPRAWPNWFLNNHDHSRVVTRYDEGGQGRARARVAAMLLLTLRGTPFLYQGEELGLADAVVPGPRVVDVDGRDPERAPLPWEPPSVAGTGAGFTNGRPWLPLPPEAEFLNAATQDEDRRSMLSLYRRLIWYRRSSAALRLGSYRALPRSRGADDVFCYLREAGQERLLVALNFGHRSVVVDASRALPMGRGHLELSTDPDRGVGGGQDLPLGALPLGPDEGVLLRV